MRVCFLADAGSINTRTWVDYFADRLGHDVHVVSVRRAGELSPSVTVHQVGSHRDVVRGAAKLTYLAQVPRIRRLVRSLHPDIVIGYRVASYGYLAAAIGIHPFVVVAQGQHIVAPDAPRANLFFARRAIAGADLSHAWAEHSGRRLIELGADPDRVFVCPRGIDLGAFGLPDGEATAPAVIATRALHRYYGIDRIVRAVALAAEELPDLTATIVGEGEARDELEDLARTLGAVGRISFTGAVANAELPVLLRQHPFYVSTVPTDGVSASLLEAMACGAFPITADNDANRGWITDGRTGRLLDDLSPAAIASAIVGAWRDHGLRRSARAANRATVEARADLDANMRIIETRYGELVGEAGGD